MSSAFRLFNGDARFRKPLSISFRAYCVLVRLWAEAPGRDIERARESQIHAAHRGCSLREIATIYRREMEYLPEDKLREMRSNGNF
jgi:hypothetical protein